MMRFAGYKHSKSIYVSVLVQVVVGEFEFVKEHWLLHPLRTGGGRVRVNVQPADRKKQKNIR